ncbi:uncharacterized protein AB675_1742 [Cyphellophora attinorum]|uniref:Uncharacterized protein n=1 Tax=Cyphellophora attinorum TaxID=1664694 RepID=A0A0N1H808_9EURO|nr:uncharacterized protein AB675_1742 [Phialophora attinorum]KPI42893.1 hypothetical protein AB675_1742 [Phialophora attinorum]
MPKALPPPAGSLSSINRRGGHATICEPTPIDNDPVPCDNPILSDDRQASHTSSVATSVLLQPFPSTASLFNVAPTIKSESICDLIMVVIERMSEYTWTDSKDGTIWPLWVGFELQLCKSGSTPDLEPPFIDLAHTPQPEENHVAKTPKQSPNKKPPTTPAGKSPAAKGTTRTRKTSPLAPVPEWLAKLCSKDESGQDFAPIGDRRGARYDFAGLEQIVRALKTWCIQNNARLPAVEALPVTIGMLYEAQVDSVKHELNEAKRTANVAESTYRDAVRRKARTANAYLNAWEAAKIDVQDQQAELAKVKEHVQNANETLPQKRVHKTRSPNKVSPKKGATPKRVAKLKKIVKKKAVDFEIYEDGS